MSDRKLTTKRAKLLADLEYIVGGNCFNGNIQNHGAGGRYQGSGRDFRYPLTLVDAAGNPFKRKGKADEMDLPMLQSGCYTFGSNKLAIVEALDQVLTYLEERYELKL